MHSVVDMQSPPWPQTASGFDILSRIGHAVIATVLCDCCKASQQSRHAFRRASVMHVSEYQADNEIPETHPERSTVACTVTARLKRIFYARVQTTSACVRGRSARQYHSV
jgi:hypothetical protein